MKKQSALLIVLMFGCLSSASAEIGVTDTEISLGTVQSLSGEGAPAKSCANDVAGMQAFIEKLNRDGGIDGRKLKLVVKDSQYKEKASLELTKDLEEKDKVFALLSPFGTPFMVASRPYINRIAIPVIGPIDGDGRSRVLASFDQEASATLDVIKHVYNTDEFALYRPKTSLGESMRVQYVKWAHAKSMKISAIGEEGPNVGDVADAVKTIAKAHPKVVILGGNAPSNIAFLKAAVAAGLQTDWVVNAPGMTSEFYNGIGRTLGTVTMSHGIPMDDKLEIFRDYAAEMKRAHHEIEGYSFQGYIAGALLAEALKRVGHDVTRAKLISAMNGMHKTSLGGLELSYSAEDHTGLKGIYFFRVNKDGFAPFDTSQVQFH